jgi:hypothetical protein
MDSNKVAFIICVNNNRMYHEAEIYIKSLDIPTGFTFEIIPIYEPYCLLRTPRMAGTIKPGGVDNERKTI